MHGALAGVEWERKGNIVLIDECSAKAGTSCDHTTRGRVCADDTRDDGAMCEKAAGCR